MPLDFIYKLAKDTGKSRSEIERLWKKAKAITKDTFGSSESEWENKEYSYTVGVLKKMIGKGKSERILSMEFLKSKKSPDEFLEVVVSGDFDIGNVIPPGRKKKKKKDFGKEKDINTDPGTGDYPLVITHEQDEKEEKATKGTDKCPGCDGKYLIATGYCPKCKKKVAKPNPKNEKIMEQYKTIPIYDFMISKAQELIKLANNSTEAYNFDLEMETIYNYYINDYKYSEVCFITKNNDDTYNITNEDNIYRLQNVTKDELDIYLYKYSVEGDLTKINREIMVLKPDSDIETISIFLTK